MAEKIKLGLAFSGGGFRAALFHLGVLARMADLGLLRHVEVISTVSGGSVIGAFYYLHLKQLLERKADRDITGRDYQELVARIEKEFLTGVQKNVLARTFSNPWKTSRMSLPHYSRSDRLGEIYDRLFFRPVKGKGKSGPVEMREMEIRPGAGLGGRDNNSRRNKVPTILINATSLNTGHNWRFTPYSMGEPPPQGRAAREIDKNSRLWMPPSYNVITPRQQNMELGHAVAASSCVPGIFPPLSISGLYPGYRVQLVDGGVHDNQGVQGLLDAKCTHFVVSDASGYMPDEPQPDTQLTSVLYRAKDICSDRVREEQLMRLLESEEFKVVFINLLKGLETRVIHWNGKDRRPASSTAIRRSDRKTVEETGIKEQIRRLTAGIRTDLDSFNDLESYTLMLSGYLIGGREFSRGASFQPLMKENPDGYAWRFMRLAPWMERPTETLVRQLEVSGHKFFKVFRLNPILAAATLTVLGGGLLAGGVLAADEIERMLNHNITAGELLLVLSLLTVGFIPRISRQLKMMEFLRAPSEFVVRLATRVMLPMFLCPLAWLELLVFDPIYLRMGRYKAGLAD